MVGGAIYDMASGLWGSADAAAPLHHAQDRRGGRLSAVRTLLRAVDGVGRLQPGPVQRRFTAPLSVQATKRLQLRLRGEAYQFENTETETPLVIASPIPGGGSPPGGTYQVSNAWQAQLGYENEFGTGASSSGWDGNVTFSPNGKYSIMVYGNSLSRPLEYR